ncbi:MAG: hypothetical protein M0R30_14100 [Methanoregula sp.]|uniref:hypothetical protein n=1 Tax=Methanoregula sp. TaxID=2052170 RepID=UPI0025FF03BD|nr:hypothetical protein [Methanoregula sp.]MCK9632759.1 hypothetical protein [Methanoregula sp.]
MMWIALVIFAIGIVFGFVHKGTEDYRGLIRNSAIAGVVISVILLLLSMVLLPGEVSSGYAIVGVFGLLVQIIIFVAIFIIGAFVGDKLEQVIRK